jgi:uncharacterized membrane protein YgcG
LARVAACALGLQLWHGAEARGQDRTPIPEFTGKRVYISGIPNPDRYAGLAEEIVRLERTSPQTYYVVVIPSSGRGASATRDYVDAVYETWREQAATRGLSLDPRRSVILVVALENQQCAVHTGTALRSLGLHRDAIERELIEHSGFLELARADRYPEAIAALLKVTERWVAGHEVAAPRAPARVAADAKGPTASSPVVATRPAPPVATPPAVAARPATLPTGTIAVTPPGPAQGSLGGTLAGGIGIALLVIILAVLGLIWLAHRRVRGRVHGRLKEVRSRATELMDRLDALKERLKLLPVEDPDFKVPMSGKTLALYNAAQGALGQLWDRWLRVMDELDRAQKLAAATSSPFDRRKLHEAESLLEQKGVFEEIEAQIQASVADMDRLNQAHETAHGVLEALGAAKPKLEAQVETVRKLSLPVAPYQEELGAIQAGTTEAGAVLTADPLGAGTALQALRARTEALAGRLERVATLFQQAQQAGTALEGVKRQVANQRAGGLRLAEVGGNPDHFLGQGDQSHAQALMALRAGDPDSAAQKLETARSMAQQAEATIEQVRKARAYCEREQPNRVRETERLRAALPQAESYHRDLERGFAPASWQAVARNLDQARALVSTFDRLAEDAAASASAASQKYLAGARLLEQLAQQQQIALRLMSGLGEQLNALAALRGECQRRRGELEALGRRVASSLRQHDPILGAMAHDSLAAALEAQDRVLGQMDDPRPDWPAVRQALAAAIEEFGIAQSQAEADLRAHEQLSGEYDRARRELERVADLLSGRREDRVAANRHFRAAAEVLDQVGLDLEAPHGEWTRLLERVRGAQDDLEQAEGLAREDIRLAGQAQSEVAEADRAIRQARAYFEMGVTVDTSAAESALEQAKDLLRAQDYERAIDTAGAAVEQARQAYQAAAQQASWRQMQVEADRRRWEAASDGSAVGAALSAGATAAAVAAGVILDRVAQAASEATSAQPESMAEPMIAPQPGESDSGQATWESDSGQGQW